MCTIDLPPLRERGDDIPILAHYFLARYNREFGKEVRDVAPEAMARLRGYAWPGNIRELQSVLKQALLRSSGSTLLAGFLPELGAGPRRSSPPPITFDLQRFIGRELAATATDLYADTHREVDRVLLARVLAFTKGNHRQAAPILGIARATMRAKLRAVGLHVTHVVSSDDKEDDVRAD